jgi:glycosyltransferase involved in cell wall biosynthesis
MIKIVIPTRNRADLAIAAARSVASQKNCHFRLVISDNSSNILDREHLRQFCSNAGIQLLETTQDLPMDQHWDWAFSQITDYDYIGILTDRMVLYPGALNELSALIERNDHPAVLSFNNDNVASQGDYFAPIQRRYSGKLESILSSSLVESTARAQITTSLPRGLNCLIRRDIVECVNDLGGKYFESIAPDFNFAFKVLSIVQRVHYLDKPLIISYGNSRSNGGSLTTGRLNKDSKDFLQFVSPESSTLSGSPMPDIFQATNVVCHEYGVVREKYASCWPAPQIAEWIDLIARRVRDSDGELSTAWKSRLIKKYGVSPSFFPPLEMMPVRHRIASRLAKLSPRGMAIAYRLLGKPYFLSEAQTINYLIKNRIEPAPMSSINMDF